LRFRVIGRTKLRTVSLLILICRLFIWLFGMEVCRAKSA